MKILKINKKNKEIIFLKIGKKDIMVSF